MSVFDKAIKKKYAMKSVANFISLLLGVITQVLVPRALGPAVFGQMSYLNSIFQQIFSFLDLGFINYFYTRFASNSKDSLISTFYIIYFFAISGLIFLFTVVILTTDLWLVFSIGASEYFLYSFFWALLFTLTLIFDKCADALGLTVRAEKIRISNKIFFAFLLVFLLYSTDFNLRIYFYYMFALYLSLLIQFYFLFIGVNEKIFSQLREVLQKFKELFFEFLQNSKHLITLISLGSLAIVIDRWLLQFVGGDEQQGFYAFAYLLASICMIFTSAFIPLIWREITFNLSADNKPYLSATIESSFRLIFILATSICCFLFIFGDIFLLIAAGERYEKALVVVLIMSLYPIHQTYGQLSSAMFIALSQTKILSIISCSYIITGIIFSPLFMLNLEIFGIESAAVGLAIKMVIWQYISVNTQLYFNCKYANYSFLSLFTHQHVFIFTVLCLVFVIRFFYEMFFLGNNDIVLILSSFVTYIVIMAILSYYFRDFFGIKAELLKNRI